MESEAWLCEMSHLRSPDTGRKPQGPILGEAPVEMVRFQDFTRDFFQDVIRFFFMDSQWIFYGCEMDFYGC